MVLLENQDQKVLKDSREVQEFLEDPVQKEPPARKEIKENLVHLELKDLVARWAFQETLDPMDPEDHLVSQELDN